MDATFFEHAPPDLRTVLRAAATPVTVITALRSDGQPHGTTIGSFTSLSLDPPLVLWSLQRTTDLFATLVEASYIGVNVLAHDQAFVARRFAARNVDRFAEVTLEAGLAGLPLIVGSLAWLECAREATFEGGDHTIFVARVLRARSFKKRALLHCEGDYAHPERFVSA